MTDIESRTNKRVDAGTGPVLAGHKHNKPYAGGPDTSVSAHDPPVGSLISEWKRLYWVPGAHIESKPDIATAGNGDCQISPVGIKV